MEDVQEAFPLFVSTIPEVQKILSDLHVELSQGINNPNTQKKIDKYLLICAMEMKKSNLVSLLPWQTFIISDENIFNIRHLPDLGIYVRHIILHSNIQKTQIGMQRVIQHSMPFIKHNRLTFPSISEFKKNEIAQLLRVILSCCIGLIPGCNKKPTFFIRVQLFCMFHEMLCSHNYFKMYAFCRDNLGLLRVALMEYFLYFASEFMPMEFEFMSSVYRFETERDSVCKHLKVAVDHLRQACFQNSHVDWDDVKQKTHLCNERCNRLCKGKIKYNHKKNEVFNLKLDPSFTSQSIQLCKMPHVLYMKQIHKNVDIVSLSYAYLVHKTIKIKEIPYNIFQKQLQCVREMYMKQSTITNKALYLHYCVKCAKSDKQSIDTCMRIDTQNKVYCSHCQDSDCMVKINMLGRFVKINKSTYIFCAVCKRIHECKHTDMLFGSKCPFKAISYDKVKSKECFQCQRTVNIYTFNSLDQENGLIFPIHFCYRHSPRIQSLKFCVTVSHFKRAFENRNESNV